MGGFWGEVLIGAEGEIEKAIFPRGDFATFRPGSIPITSVYLMKRI